MSAFDVEYESILGSKFPLARLAQINFFDPNAASAAGLIGMCDLDVIHEILPGGEVAAAITARK